MRSVLVRHAGALAALLAVLTVVVAVMGIAAEVRFDPDPMVQLPLRTAELLAWGLTASVLLSRRPDLAFGWIFAVGAVAEILYVGLGVPAYLSFRAGDGDELTLWAYSLAGIQWMPSVLTGVVFCRFPTGRPTGRTWRTVDRVLRWGIVLAVVVGVLEGWSGHDAVGATQRFVDRTPIPSVASDLLVVIPLLVLLSGLAGVSVIVRWYRARDLERRRLAGLPGAALAYLVGWPLAIAGAVPDPVMLAAAFVLPVAVLVPVLRYDLWAIDSVVRRSATYHLRGAGTLDGVVRAVADLLRVPYVAVRTEDVVLASYGEEQTRVESWSIQHEGHPLGELVAAPRFGHPALTPDERAVLASTAALVGGSVRAEALTSDLHDARHRLVTAREEERRRLRRDLHDGIGPTLTGLGLSLDAARADPDRAGEHLARAKDASTEAIRSLRELVHDLRPPALDDLGFAGALTMQVRRVAGPRATTVTVPEGLVLPAAVEVAALRTAVEAVHNAVRHGDATTVRVTVTVPDDLVLTITDDGGRTPWPDPGVGLTSMRERAEELGGTLVAGATPEGGRVQATYPLSPLRRTS